MSYKHLKDTKNFKVTEFTCKHCGKIPDNPAVAYHIQRLQRFRTWYKRTMKVNSGYRCEVHNKNIGGAKASRHMQGIATDFPWAEDYKKMSAVRKKEFEENIKKKWQELCKGDGCGGAVLFYSWGFHLDSRPGAAYFNDYR